MAEPTTEEPTTAEPTRQESYSFGIHSLSCTVRESHDDAMLFDDGELTGDAFDDTGLHHVWPASLVLCRWLEANRHEVARARILELGAGTGLPSLLCTQLSAAAVVAVDVNAAVVAQLNESFHKAGSQACALCMGWEDDALFELATSLAPTHVLLADVVYPMKEQTALLATLDKLLHAHPGLHVIVSTSCRDPVVHESFVAGLRALPATMQMLVTDDTAVDPLYGPATVYIYRVHSPTRGGRPSGEGSSKTSGASMWRFAAARLQLWPVDRPAGVAPYSHGWVHSGNERMLRQLIRERAPRVIVELGSWLGLCTTLLLEESADVGSAIFAVDRWDASFLLQTQREQYADDAEALELLAELPLYETFLVNMWAHRTRLFPLRMATHAGMATICELGAAEAVGLVYVDADHTHEAVLEDVRTAARCFPAALLTGDDWQWPGVRTAIEQYVTESNGRLRCHAHAAENWWWLEPVPSQAERARTPAAQPPRVAVEFVPATPIS